MTGPCLKLNPSAANRLPAVDRCLARLEAAWPQWPEDKRAHFLQVLSTVLDCYLEEERRAVMMVSESDDLDAGASLLAINAEEAQIDLLVRFLLVFRDMEGPIGGQLQH